MLGLLEVVWGSFVFVLCWLLALLILYCCKLDMYIGSTRHAVLAAEQSPHAQKHRDEGYNLGREEGGVQEGREVPAPYPPTLKNSNPPLDP